MAKRFWKISVIDGQDDRLIQSLPEGMLSQSEIMTLLQRLASRDLTDNDVIHASLRKSAKNYSPALEVTYNRGGKFALMITGGLNTYTATIGRA